MRRRMPFPFLLAAAAGLALLDSTGPAFAQPAAAPEGEAETFATADGVQLVGRFHKSTKDAPNESPVVILMYSPGKDKDMTKGDWVGLANRLAGEGFNVFRFDWRGHGQSKTISDPNKFWNVTLPGQTENIWTGPIHQNPRYVKGFNKLRLKRDISYADFTPGYVAVYAEDLAAVRVHLDQKNDRGAVNTSRVYLIGEQDAATIGMIWMAAEWMRHDTNVFKGSDQVSYSAVPLPAVALAFKPLEVRAGSTIRGAIWLTPKVAAGVNSNQLTKLFDPNIQPGMRQTPMLFMYQSEDQPGKAAATTFFRTIVNAAPPPSGPLQAVKNTYTAEIKGKTKAVGAALLGNNASLGTEDKIVKYLKEILPSAKIESKQREFTAPYYIDLGYFGFSVIHK